MALRIPSKTYQLTPDPLAATAIASAAPASSAAELGRYVFGKFAAVLAAAFIVVGCTTPNRGAENGCCVYVSDGSGEVPSLIALDESLERDLLKKISPRVRPGNVCWYQMPEGGIGADVPGLQYIFVKKDEEWVLENTFLVHRSERVN